ncbi:MAG: hypothetical protein AB7O59_14155 [Pirellulales bacterium]
MRLVSHIFFSQPLFTEAQLDGLQAILNDLLPFWTKGLRVARYEHSPDKELVGRDNRLFDRLYHAAPPKRTLGEAVLTGVYSGLSFYLSHCQGTLPPVLNDMSVEVYELARIEGKRAFDTTRDLFEAFVTRLPVRYANVRSSDEYDAKNILDDDSGVQAIGADIEVAIPGLYWLNYFGPPYVEMLGRERLLTAPAFEAKALGDGVLLALDESPEAWQQPSYRQREQDVVNHLGPHYFFSRRDPDRKTIAPDFYAFRAREQNP